MSLFPGADEPAQEAPGQDPGISPPQPGVHWIAFQRDTTGRKQAEEALRANEERLRLALESCGESAWQLDVDTDVVRVDRTRQSALLTYEPGEWSSEVEWLKARVSPDDLEMLQKLLARHAAGQAPLLEAECRFRTRADDWGWVLIRGKIIARNPQGQPLRLAGTLRDISEEKWLRE